MNPDYPYGHPFYEKLRNDDCEDEIIDDVDHQEELEEDNEDENE